MPVPGLDLLQDLFDRLVAHLAAVHDDDVAELAGERTAARTLHDAVSVAFLQDVDPGRRRIGQVDFLKLNVMIGCFALCMLTEKSRPGILRLALEKYIAVRPALTRQQVGYRPSQDDSLAQSAKPIGNLEDSLDLDDEAGDTNEVGVGSEVHVLAGVLIADRDGVFRGRKSRQGKQAQRWEDSAERSQRDEVFHAPVRRRELRLHQIDLGLIHPS